MSSLLLILIALSDSPDEIKLAPPARVAVSGPELRDAVRAAFRKWARPSDRQADAAAQEFLAHYADLQCDRELARSQKEYLLTKTRIRLMKLSDQIAKRVAREKRLAISRAQETASRAQETARIPAGEAAKTGSAGIAGKIGDAGDVREKSQGEKHPSKAEHSPLFGSGGPAFGGGAMGLPDHGQELVDLIQTVIRPESWDVNGGPGSIYYWYPGRALVIRQMGEVHEQIGGTLDQLRRAAN